MTSKNEVVTEAKQNNKRKAEPSKSLLSIVTKLVSFSSVFSILMGFGYISGIASSFGYSAFDIVADTKSFIFQGLYPLFKLFFEKLSWNYWGNLIVTSVCSWDVFIYIGASLIAYLLYKKFFNVKINSSQICSKIKKARRSYENQSTYFKFTLETTIVIVISVLYKVFITLLMYGAFVAFTSILILGFGIGFQEGSNFAKEEIIEPKQCAPYIKKTGKNIEKTAYCAKVTVDGKELDRGRVIAFNNERIFLFVRSFDKTGKVIRIPKSYPIRNAVVERVDTEDLPTDVQQLSDVEQAIKDHQLTALPLACLSYKELGTLDDKQTFVVHEKHDSKCGGDPNSAPRLFRIAIDQEGAVWSDINTMAEAGELEKLVH